MTLPSDPTVPVKIMESAGHQAMLGRRYAPDYRDRRFALTADRLHEIPRQLTPGARRRTLPWHLSPAIPLNQGDTDACTIYFVLHALLAAPHVHAAEFIAGLSPLAMLMAAKRVDEWPGEDYDGTSARAALKIFQQAGLIGDYLWATDEDIAKEYLATRGPLGLGSDWWTGMDTPDAHGYVEPTGTVRGGHEYMVRWYYNTAHKKYPDTIECVNSWGPGYGQNGIFRMKMDAFRYLWLQTNGDLVSPLEPEKARKR